jgi:hypothetical protein
VRTFSSQNRSTQQAEVPCSGVWQTEGEKVAPALAVYAERDDANHSRKTSDVLDSLTVNWVNVPAARAEQKFAAFDYCAEISRTEQTHVAKLLGE